MLVFLHPLVDFCSVVVLVTGGFSIERWLAYNAIAFAFQLPLGMALDVQRGWARGGFCIGCVLAASAAVAATFGFAGWFALVVACLGNALFHLTAGANVLERDAGKSGPIGLFISTGALGLMAGQVVAGINGASVVIVTVAVALVTGMVYQMIQWDGGGATIYRRARMNACEAVHCGRFASACTWVVAGLFALVVWRSWAGLLSGRMSTNVSVVLVFVGAFVTWAGKAAGGYLSDVLTHENCVPHVRPAQRLWCGFSPRVIVTMVSVVGSASLCFLCSPSNILLWLVSLFLAQLATGPVLSLLYEWSGCRVGTAFGLNCFGLFTGSLI